jgi:hypothetical protein
LGNCFEYGRTKETFGITSFPKDLAAEYKMRTIRNTKNDDATLVLTRESVMQLAAIPAIGLGTIGYSSKDFLYRFLSRCQGTDIAITAVHTAKEEKLLTKWWTKGRMISILPVPPKLQILNSLL